MYSPSAIEIAPATRLATPASTIARYVGVYDLPDGRTIAIGGARDSMLSAQVAGAPPVLLLPNGQDRFYAYTADLDVRFDTTGLTLDEVVSRVVELAERSVAVE